MTRWRPRSPATDENTHSVPPPRASSRTRAASQNCTVCTKFAVSSVCRCLASASSASCVSKRAAVTTMVSTPSRARSAASSAGSKLSGSSRSQCAVATSPCVPRSSRSRALRASCCTSRPSRHSRAPHPASSRARARPMPRVAPSKTTFTAHLPAAARTARWPAGRPGPTACGSRGSVPGAAPWRRSARAASARPWPGTPGRRLR